MNVMYLLGVIYYFLIVYLLTKLIEFNRDLKVVHKQRFFRNDTGYRIMFVWALIPVVNLALLVVILGWALLQLIASTPRSTIELARQLFPRKK